MAKKPEELLPWLFASPLALAVVAIIFVSILIVGVALLWAYKMLTGVLIGGVLLVIVWTLLQTKALPTDKYPWAPLLLMLLPIGGFLFGVWGERTGVFYVTPLMEKTEPVAPFYAAEPLQFVTGNIEIALIFILMICIAVAFARAKE